MTSLKLFGAVALVSVAFATQAFAQAAVQEPGAFAFYHPNADVLNGRWAAPAEAMAALPAPGLRLSVRPHKVRHTSSRRAF
jgi:hypothetical protein